MAASEHRLKPIEWLAIAGSLASLAGFALQIYDRARSSGVDESPKPLEYLTWFVIFTLACYLCVSIAYFTHVFSSWYRSVRLGSQGRYTAEVLSMMLNVPLFGAIVIYFSDELQVWLAGYTGESLSGISLAAIKLFGFLLAVALAAGALFLGQTIYDGFHGQGQLRFRRPGRRFGS